MPIGLCVIQISAYQHFFGYSFIDLDFKSTILIVRFYRLICWLIAKGLTCTSMLSNESDCQTEAKLEEGPACRAVTASVFSCTFAGHCNARLCRSS